MTHITAPTVSTLAATDIAPTTFTANGEVTGLGGAGSVTERGFAWYQGAAGDPTTADNTEFESGVFGDGPFSQDFSGLLVNTSYRVRAYAINSEATGYGATITVQTEDLAPPVASNLVAELVGAPGLPAVDLTWDPDPQYAHDVYEVRRETFDGLWGSQVVLADDLVDELYTDEGLEAATLYRYSVRGINSEGPGPWTDWEEITTPTFQAWGFDQAPHPVEFIEGDVQNPWSDPYNYSFLATGIVNETLDETASTSAVYRYRIGLEVGEGGELMYTPWIAVVGELAAQYNIGDVAPAASDSVEVRVTDFIREWAPAARDTVALLNWQPPAAPTLLYPPNNEMPHQGTLLHWSPNSAGFDQEAFSVRRRHISFLDDYDFEGPFADRWFPEIELISVLTRTSSAASLIVGVAPASEHLHFFDLETRELVKTMAWGLSTPVRDVAFSPDGNWLAVDGRVINLDTYAVTVVSTSIEAVVFSPDSTKVAMGRALGGGQVEIYDVGGAWDHVLTFDMPLTSGGSRAGVQARGLDWSPNGSWIAAAHNIAARLDPDEPGTQPVFGVFSASTGSIVMQNLAYETAQEFFQLYTRCEAVAFYPDNSRLMALLRPSSSGPSSPPLLVIYQTGGSWTMVEDLALDGQATSLAVSEDSQYFATQQRLPVTISDPWHAVVARTSDFVIVHQYRTDSGLSYPQFIEGSLSAPAGYMVGVGNPGSSIVRAATTGEATAPAKWWDGAEWVETEQWVLDEKDFEFFDPWEDSGDFGPADAFLWSVATRDAYTGLEGPYADNFRFRLGVVPWVHGFTGDQSPAPTESAEVVIQEPTKLTVYDAAPTPTEAATVGIRLEAVVSDIAPLDPDIGIFAVPPTLIAPAEDALVDGALDVDFTWQFNTDNADTQGEYALWVEGEGWWNGSTFVANQVWVASPVETVTIPPSAWSSSP